ncbi:MAG: hypothetical protein MUF77_03270 [Leptospira sp.]|nr:hypothetical protein [Leptospira sp.]
MNSLLIQLAGQLSAELGSELYLKVKAESQTPGLFCLDFTEVVEITEVGREYLKKTANRCKEVGSKLAGFGVCDELISHLDQVCITYETKPEAIEYLETFIMDGTPANELSPSPETPAPKFIITQCPNCFSKLRIQNFGDHLCPSCHTKFFVGKKGWAQTYERLL